MISNAPPFWWRKPGWQAYVLKPLSSVYGWIAGKRMRREYRPSVDVPVICVGNFTVGGAGKTPTAIAIAQAAIAKGLRPGFLSRGYGGTLDVTTLVEPHHRAKDVGDEPLLLDRYAMTVVSRRRIDGAHRLVEAGADLIIMDDGFQSARLMVDYTLVVIDSVRGIGNGFTIPAGPVRAPISEQMRQLSAILKVGDGAAADELVRTAARAGKTIYVAGIQPTLPGRLTGTPVIAYAGIADPDKFYRTVESLGANIMERRSFSDHHTFEDDEVADLLDTAAKRQHSLVTTAKDVARLKGAPGRAEELRRRSYVIEIEMVFDDPNTPSEIIDAAIENCRTRRLCGTPAK
ncbi:tetraacyldisaccharide 4'-kinase [Agrobacterium sp.]|jgi:tetraacyldisaccharide 4'-kinase|uniref:tetraacyldisaccharide 4'-kinase n=1 Tax=Agrobacterium sp. TaxID=361 RepID=UPI0028A9248C